MSATQDLNQYPAMNPTFTVSEVESTDSQARLVIEPLEQGYGHTLGNSLRRVLLSSLPGAAITSVTIDGVDHQYTTLEGLSEDIIDFILNLKQVRINATGNDKGVLRLTKKGPATITAADIECEAGFAVVNPELVVATLAKGKSINAELTVETGVGYRMASEVKSQVIGQIMVDALFSPVIKVSYKVEATRVGRRTDYDRIVLDVQTDGSVSPIEAVRQAASILVKQFGQVVSPTVPVAPAEMPAVTPEEAEVLKLTVEELDLPTRIANALRKGGFKTVGDLVMTKKGVIAKVKNLGGKSVTLINDALLKKGFSLED